MWHYCVIGFNFNCFVGTLFVWTWFKRTKFLTCSFTCSLWVFSKFDGKNEKPAGGGDTWFCSVWRVRNKSFLLLLPGSSDKTYCILLNKLRQYLIVCKNMWSGRSINQIVIFLQSLFSVSEAQVQIFDHMYLLPKSRLKFHLQESLSFQLKVLSVSMH